MICGDWTFLQPNSGSEFQAQIWLENIAAILQHIVTSIKAIHGIIILRPSIDVTPLACRIKVSAIFSQERFILQSSSFF